jgi:hypothetical protein
MLVEVGKKYKTANGFDVRIYAVDGSNSDAIHGAYHDGGHWVSMSWDQEGKYTNSPHQFPRHNAEFDLVQPPLECWINTYPDYCATHFSESSAKKSAGKNVIRTAVHMREVSESWKHYAQ